MSDMDECQIKAERAKFEKNHCGGNLTAIRRDGKGEYLLPGIQGAWMGWLAKTVVEHTEKPYLIRYRDNRMEVSEDFECRFQRLEEAQLWWDCMLFKRDIYFVISARPK